VFEVRNQFAGVSDLCAGGRIVGLAATVCFHLTVWPAIALGGAFGAGGYVFDYFTRSRFGGRQLSAWAFAIGGGLAGMYWIHYLHIRGAALISL
jgi:hypothetical protein